MKRQLNKWQIVCQFSAEFARYEPGWRNANVGLIKLTSFPPEGQRIGKENYKGIILRWRYWLPFERGDK